MAQDDTPSETEIESVADAGTRLKSAREAMGLSLQDAASRTRQSRDLLNALETMQTGAYSSTFVRMHARNYARALGLPEEEIASAYAAARATADSSKMPGARLERKESAARGVLLAGAGVIAAVVIAGIVMLAMPNQTGPRIEAPVSSKVLGAASERVVVKPQELRTTGPELSIVARRDAFIEVRASDGTVFRAREMAAGEVYFPRIGAGWTITVQDAGAFEWQLGDTVIGALGDDGTALYGVKVDDGMERALQMVSEALADASKESASGR